MDIVCIDFETTYDREYSLSKMTTESYIRDPRFQVIGVSIGVNGEEPEWFTGDGVDAALRRYCNDKCAILCHNTAFDGAILSWHYGIRPTLWLDTMSMARPFHGITTGVSLHSLSKHYSLGEKGTAVANYLGFRFENFTSTMLADYGEYCKQDNRLTYALFKKLAPMVPASEIELIDMTIRMFTEPMFEFDKQILEDHLVDVQAKKERFLVGGGAPLKEVLMSNDKFAAALRACGVEPPMKISKTTGKLTYAFAKTDTDFTALRGHTDMRVQFLVAARLGVKSTIEETRTQSFLGIASRGKLPILLNYWGAHPGRFSGGDKVNLQNLPRGGKIRDAIKAPAGHKVVVCDSAQIEARLVSYMAKQDDLVQAFREGRDVYSEFATEIFGKPITKKDKIERFIGKTCLGSDTMVLTESGWKPIVNVEMHDKLWDGTEWVNHAGLIEQGEKEVLTLAGVKMTPDHEVWTQAGWVTAASLQDNSRLMSLALATALESSPSRATRSKIDPELSRRSLFSVTAGVLAIPFTASTLQNVGLANALTAYGYPCPPPAWSYGLSLYRTGGTVAGYSAGSGLPSTDAITRATKALSTTVEGVSRFATNGETTPPSSSPTSKQSPDGTMPPSKWTGSKSTGTTNQETYGSSPEATTTETSGKYQTSKERSLVYDLASSGSKHRFTILTERGPLIVHNCVLSLGYMAGAERFRAMLASGVAGPAVHIDETEAKRIVQVYRRKNHKIVSLWTKFGNVLKQMVGVQSGEILDHLPLHYTLERIILPNNMYINYPGLTTCTNSGFQYYSRKQPKKIYSGKAVENATQALARLVIVEQMLRIGKRYRVVLQVHDEIVCIVPDDQVEEATRFIQEVMSTPPAWAPYLPVACEIGVGESYGSAKN